MKYDPLFVDLDPSFWVSRDCRGEGFNEPGLKVKQRHHVATATTCLFVAGELPFRILI
jgi:hypothetical protein